jgi:hypothetical protein
LIDLIYHLLTPRTATRPGVVVSCPTMWPRSPRHRCYALL